MVKDPFGKRQVTFESYDEVFVNYGVPYKVTYAPQILKASNTGREVFIYQKMDKNGNPEKDEDGNIIRLYGPLFNYNLLNSDNKIYLNSLEEIVKKSEKLINDAVIVLESQKKYYFIKPEDMKKFKTLASLFV